MNPYLLGAACVIGAIVVIAGGLFLLAQKLPVPFPLNDTYE